MSVLYTDILIRRSAASLVSLFLAKRTRAFSQSEPNAIGEIVRLVLRKSLFYSSSEVKKRWTRISAYTRSTDEDGLLETFCSRYVSSKYLSNQSLRMDQGGCTTLILWINSLFFKTEPLRFFFRAFSQRLLYSMESLA